MLANCENHHLKQRERARVSSCHPSRRQNKDSRKPHLFRTRSLSLSEAILSFVRPRHCLNQTRSLLMERSAFCFIATVNQFVAFEFVDETKTNGTNTIQQAVQDVISEAENKAANDSVRCPCGSTYASASELLIQCEGCESWQHLGSYSSMFSANSKTHFVSLFSP